MNDNETQRAILASIAAEPDNELNRLAYADWMEEHDEQARGEFIRVQCELAADEKVPTLAPGRRLALKKRETELLKAHEQEWAGAAADYQPQFRRGFVERVTLEVRDVDQAAAQLQALRAAMPTIAGVRLLSAGINALQTGDFLSRKACHGLRELELVNAGRADMVAGAIAWADKLALERLSIENATYRLTAQGMEVLARSPHLARLRALNLSGNPIGHSGLRNLVDPQCKFKLEELELGSCGLDSADIGMLAGSERLGGLRKLVLNNNRIGQNGVDHLARSPHLGQLETLEMANNQMSHAALSALMASKTLGGLRHLDVSGFSNRSSMDCSLDALARLRKLTMQYAGINAESLQQLLALRQLEQLQELDLSNNPLGEAGAEILAQTRSLPALQVLGLHGCRLGAEGVSRLERATNFDSLCHLDIGNNASTDRLAMRAQVESAVVGAVGKMTLGMRAQLEANDPQHVTVRE